MWCRSAVNRIFLSFAAARHTHSSALGAPCRLCVRGAFCWGRFPSASPLPSTPSAASCPALFGDFIGTAGPSDFLGSFIVGVRPWTSRRVPPLICGGRTQELPVLVRGASVRARGL